MEIWSTIVLAGQILGGIFVALIAIPVMVYLIVKFGATAYFRAKHRHNKEKDEHE